jgi:hypothetical protein
MPAAASLRDLMRDAMVKSVRRGRGKACARAEVAGCPGACMCGGGGAGCGHNPSPLSVRIRCSRVSVYILPLRVLATRPVHQGGSTHSMYCFMASSLDVPVSVPQKGGQWKGVRESRSLGVRGKRRKRSHESKGLRAWRRSQVGAGGGSSAAGCGCGTAPCSRVGETGMPRRGLRSRTVIGRGRRAVAVAQVGRRLTVQPGGLNLRPAGRGVQPRRPPGAPLPDRDCRRRVWYLCRTFFPVPGAPLSPALGVEDSRLGGAAVALGGRPGGGGGDGGGEVRGLGLVK